MPTATSDAATVRTMIARITPRERAGVGPLGTISPERDQVDVGGVEHDLDGHQHGDGVAPHEHARQADGERRRGEVEEPGQRDVGTHGVNSLESENVMAFEFDERSSLHGEPRAVEHRSVAGGRGCRDGRRADRGHPPRCRRALEPARARRLPAAGAAGSGSSRWAIAIAPTSAAVKSRPGDFERDHVASHQLVAHDPGHVVDRPGTRRNLGPVPRSIAGRFSVAAHEYWVPIPFWERDPERQHQEYAQPGDQPREPPGRRACSPDRRPGCCGSA